MDFGTLESWLHGLYCAVLVVGASVFYWHFISQILREGATPQAPAKNRVQFACACSSSDDDDDLLLDWSDDDTDSDDD